MVERTGTVARSSSSSSTVVVVLAEVATSQQNNRFPAEDHWPYQRHAAFARAFLLAGVVVVDPFLGLTLPAYRLTHIRT
jgi:ribosomal protein S19E (S16A)